MSTHWKISFIFIFVVPFWRIFQDSKSPRLKRLFFKMIRLWIWYLITVVILSYLSVQFMSMVIWQIAGHKFETYKAYCMLQMYMYIPVCVVSIMQCKAQYFESSSCRKFYLISKMEKQQFPQFFIDTLFVYLTCTTIKLSFKKCWFSPSRPTIIINIQAH